jgi:hypothetical protein
VANPYICEYIFNRALSSVAFRKTAQHAVRTGPSEAEVEQENQRNLLEESKMRRRTGRSTFLAVCVCLFASLMFTWAAASGQFTSGQKAKVKGTIVSRSGDLVKIQDKKSGSVALPR